MKLSPSRLSDVLAGKGHLSVERANSIAQLLKLTPIVTTDFIDSAEAVGRGTKSLKHAANRRVETRNTSAHLRKFADDEVAILSDWRNLAVWTFMTLPSFDGKRQTIADHFKMNVIEVDEILTRLERVKMVTFNGKTGVIGSTQAYAGGAFPNASLCDFHRQMSTLGKTSIDAQTFEERHLESAILTFDQSKYGEIQQKIANFCRSLVSEYSEQPKNDMVYGLSLQFFRI